MSRFFYFIAFVLLPFCPINAQSNWVDINQPNPAPAEIKLKQSNIEQTYIQFSLEGYYERQIETPRGIEKMITIDNGAQILKKGKPDLPKLATSIIIPDTDEMEVNIIRSNYIEFTDVEVAPSKGHFDRNVRPEDVPFTYGKAYETDEFWPGKLAQLEKPFIMRDFRGQTLTIFPLQYNPVNKTLRVYTEIEVEVTTAGSRGANPLIRKRDQIVIEPEFGKIYERFFLNNDDAHRGYPMLEGEEGSLLIICYEDFLDEMKPFVNWKRTIGRKTVMVSTAEAGNSVSEIQSFVEDYYNDNADFAYLLLVGDGPQIPPVVTSWGQSDNAYGFLEGDDSYNDIFVGRFSAENIAEVETQVRRMIEYERDIDETDTWLSTGMGIARNEGAGHHGEPDHVHMDFIKDTLLNFTYDVIHQHYENVSGMPNPSAADISADVEDGVSIINFCNHGSVTGWSVASYSISHVNNLTNTGKLPFIWSVACVNGAFVNNFCFAEAWLRATHNDEPAGAIGMKAATINQPWQPPMCGQDEMVSILTQESIQHGNTIKRTYGGASTNGSMFMIPQYGAQGTRTHETWILFGDPTLMVRTDAPEPFNPDYISTAFLGWPSYTVNNIENGSTVALTMVNDNGEVEILGVAVAENNSAEIVFAEPLSVPGDMTLAITGFNKVTYINEEIPVIPPEGPYIIMREYKIAGEPAYGETIMFSIEVENIGIETAENIQLKITSDDEFVNIANDTYSWGNIDDGVTETHENVFEVQLDMNIPDQHLVEFGLVFENAEGVTWNAGFSFNVDAPAFEILSVTVDDSETGNDNQILDPGEIAHLNITLKNTGHSDAPGLMAKGSPLTDKLVFLDEQVDVGDIFAGQEKSVVITVMGSHQSLPETAETFSLYLFKDQYLNENFIDIIVGKLPVFFMDGNNLFESCYGKFYDSGGPDYNYSNNEDYTLTFYPDVEDTQLQFIFDHFHLEESNDCNKDFLRIYDGPNTSWPLIGKYCGTEGPDTITSDNNNGAVTFSFKSGHSNTFPGWEARFYCLDPQLILNNISAYPQEIFAGETAQLSAMATGGGENITFAWTPEETLNNPSTPAPVASPTETTEYTLEISDGETTDQKSITIHIIKEKFTVTFHVEDENGNEIQNAVITLGELYNDAGDYIFENIEADTYDYKVEKTGYLTVEDEITVIDDNVTEEVVLTLALYELIVEIIPEGSGKITFAPEMNFYNMDDEVILTATAEDGYKFLEWTGETGHISEGDGHSAEITVTMPVDDIELTANFKEDDLFVEEQSSVDVRVFPNPTRDKFTVESNVKIKQIRLIDVSGQIITDRAVDALSAEIFVNDLHTGIYFIQIQTKDSVITEIVQIAR